MTTSTTPNGIPTITPAEGYRLTNGEVIAGGTVYLGKLDSPDNWREITIAEAEAIEAQREKEAEEQMAQHEKEMKERIANHSKEAAEGASTTEAAGEEAQVPSSEG